MGAKSTVEISRREAMDWISRFLSEADNTVLASVLEELNDAARNGLYGMYGEGDDLGLHNFIITD